MMFCLVEDLTGDIVDEINCDCQVCWIGDCGDEEMGIEVFV